MPNLKCRLLSPQSYIEHLGCTRAKFSCMLHRGEFTWGNGVSLPIPYDKNTFLPTLRGYTDAISTATTLGLSGCVTEEVNQNLTAKAKLLLRFHYKLGHISFKVVQWLGRQGWLGPKGIQMGHANLDAPKCSACITCKQQKTPTGTTHVKHKPPGALSENKLFPGQLIFSDQYQSLVEGRAHAGPGTGKTKKGITGGTIFVNAASDYIFGYHQVSLTVQETL